MNPSGEISAPAPDTRFSPESWGHREVRPEALDSLPAADPTAQRVRSEIELFSTLMGNHRWLLRRLRSVYEPGWRVLELGAGNGALGERMVASGIWPAEDIIGMDVSPRPAFWPSEARWMRGDIMTEPLPDAEVIVTSLLLHQFTREQLRHLGARIPSCCQMIFAAEPSRYRLPLWFGHLFAWTLQMHAVTIHDMILSVHAGFRKSELADGLALSGWHDQSSSTLLGAYRAELARISHSP
jgi:hypothetical protein